MYAHHGYMYNLKLYVEKEGKSSIAVSTNAVMNFSEKLVDAERWLIWTIFIPTVNGKHTYRWQTRLCGTLYCNIKGNPEEVITEKLKKKVAYSGLCQVVL